MTKILVIEDEDFIRYNILTILRSQQFEALGAEDGHIGVKLATQEVPDLIVCDVMMPEMNGYEVLTALRADPNTATIPFIFLTGKSTIAELRHGMQLGADDYLTKPFNKEELLGAIATRLEKQAAITQRYTLALKQATKRLNYLVHYDNLTGLPNRLLLRERLHSTLTQATGVRQISSVISFNLNRFSVINETLGSSGGDWLLKAVAERLTQCCNSNDTVARLSGDEFAIILASVPEKSDVAAFAATILNAISKPFILGNQEVFVTASMGIALYPDDGNDIDTLIQKAEAAMYHAKRLGGNEYDFYTPLMQVASPDQLILESGLHRSLERGEFQVYYQPLVDLHTGEIMGAEALLRWYHEERGMVSPAKFIPLAETNGLIIPIGEWVLKTACQQTKIWQNAGFSSFRIAVNLSGRQFNQGGLSHKVIEILESTNLEPRSLEVEVTESLLMQDVNAAINTLNQLRELGIKIAIDDFGTGYSSLSYLKQFPFNTLKIDQCFVRNVTADNTNMAITTAVIQMAHSLNLEVLAEGVETQAELKFLLQQHCEAMQGFLFSRPVPASDFEKLLFSGKRLTI